MLRHLSRRTTLGGLCAVGRLESRVAARGFCQVQGPNEHDAAAAEEKAVSAQQEDRLRRAKAVIAKGLTMQEQLAVYKKPGEHMSMRYLAERIDKISHVYEDVWATMSESDIDREIEIIRNPELKKELEQEAERKALRQPKAWVRRVNEQGIARGKGGRKNSSARVHIKEGTGEFIVNKVPLRKYFPLMYNREHCLEAFSATETLGKFDVEAFVHGGGTTGQSGAIRHACANALQAFDPAYRKIMKPLKLLRRDPRVVERKKPGQKKARKKFQWVKR